MYVANRSVANKHFVVSTTTTFDLSSSGRGGRSDSRNCKIVHEGIPLKSGSGVRLGILGFAKRQSNVIIRARLRPHDQQKLRSSHAVPRTGGHSRPSVWKAIGRAEINGPPTVGLQERVAFLISNDTSHRSLQFIPSFSMKN